MGQIEGIGLAPRLDLRDGRGARLDGRPLAAARDHAAALGAPLAPLHRPHNLAGIAVARLACPGAPQVACFDTAFRRAHPFVDDAFVIPTNEELMIARHVRAATGGAA